MKRRRLFFIVSIVLLFTTSSCGSKSETSIHGIADIEHDEWAYDEDSYGGDEVYVCTGGSSKRYHRSRYCKGLDNCKGEIKKVDEQFAEDKGRTMCNLCYKKLL